MVAPPDIALLSMTTTTHIHKSSQSQSQSPSNPNTTTPSSSTWMWNPKQQHREHEHEDEDSWEVRAFAEDTRNIMNTTWPPRSYTCSFCRREFRSAQALGGHMNVHRRDRARLHQNQPPLNSSSTFIHIPPQELVNAGLCLFYHSPNPNISSFNHSNGESPSTLLSISSSYPTNNLMMQTQTQTCSPTPFHFQANSTRNFINNSISSFSNKPAICTSIDDKVHEIEELDLELRLGNKPSPA
ncbi:unnamed protein product [Vicia faba]|uniref:C2H2-type domain-containing protein n=1 Tax=Vicia faba TaxID=3906 RepID=A0AAV0YK68_VICFA|nr:unnamed protein product [Vicia faba]